MPSELEKGIIRYVDSSILTAPYTQIFTSVIKSATSTGYTITIGGVEYTNVPSTGSVSVNETVRVVVPNNQYSNMFIIAKSVSGGGSGGAVSSVNGLTGDVYLSASDLGLGNVPNVTTNNQTPTYTVASTNTNLASGETLSVAFGKLAKIVSSFMSHITDMVMHITSTERTNWDSAYSDKHTHANKTILDNTTASYTTTEQTKLSGLSNYTLPIADDTTLGGVVSGTDITIGVDGSVSVVDNSHNHTISNVTDLTTTLSAKLDSSSYTASDVLTKLKTVDGSGSGLDSELLNGNYSSYYLSRANHTGSNTLVTYTPTASNLGTVTTHTAIAIEGSRVARYKLVANTGTWTAGTSYTICTLTTAYRPSVAVVKRIMVNQATTTYRFIQLTINTDGTVVMMAPVALSSIAMVIDETYTL